MLKGAAGMTQRVFGITGWKNSGKTTLVEKLVAELSRRGWTVSTVKHAHHDFDIDKQGTDSFRHRQAGAAEVAVVSGRRWALMHELRNEDEPPLEAILARLSALRPGARRRLQARKPQQDRDAAAGAKDTAPLSVADPDIVAIAADHRRGRARRCRCFRSTT